MGFEDVQSQWFGWLVSRTAESSAPHGAEAGGGQSAVDGGGRSEEEGQSGDVKETGQIWWGKFVEGLESECEEFGFNVLLDWEAEKILQDGVM